MKHILYIDDDPLACNLFRLFLERAGYQVTARKNVPAARREMELIHFDCIVSDVGMPGENGVEFYRWTKAQDAYKDIPFLLVSAHAMGFSDILVEHRDIFFEKPLLFTRMVEHIKTLLAE